MASVQFGFRIKLIPIGFSVFFKFSRKENKCLQIVYDLQFADHFNGLQSRLTSEIDQLLSYVSYCQYSII